jgi:hypothetical protein
MRHKIYYTIFKPINHQAIPVQKNPKLQSLPSVKEVALEVLKLTPNKHNISLSKRQIKYHSKQHGIENVNAQDKTEKRARAITDARNCMAMLCLAVYYQYSLCFNYLLHFNIDSTGFGIDLIGGGKKVKVAVTSCQVPFRYHYHGRPRTWSTNFPPIQETEVRKTFFDRGRAYSPTRCITTSDVDSPATGGT